jgi:hypothetical protein
MIRFIANSLQLQPIITAHSQWLSKTRSIPYWTMSVFSSAVPDLVLIYESVTSSASLVGSLRPQSWTMNYWTCPSEFSYEWISDWLEFTNELSLYTSGGPNRGHHTEHFVFWSLVSVEAETSEPLSSKWTSMSLVIPDFRRCLPSCRLTNDHILHNMT